MSGYGLKLTIKTHAYHPQIATQLLYTIFRIVHVLFYVFQAFLYQLLVYGSNCDSTRIYFYILTEFLFPPFLLFYQLLNAYHQHIKVERFRHIRVGSYFVAVYLDIIGSTGCQ